MWRLEIGNKTGLTAALDSDNESLCKDISWLKKGYTACMTALVLSWRTHRLRTPVFLRRFLLSEGCGPSTARCKLHSFVDDVALLVPYTEVLVHLPEVAGYERLQLMAEVRKRRL